MTLSGTAKKLEANIAAHFLAALACGMAINAFAKFDTQAAFITGLALGASASAIKVVLMERGISKSISMKSAYAGLYAVLQITMRNVLSAALLTFSAINKSVSLWGVLAGLAILQTAAFSVKWKGA